MSNEYDQSSENKRTSSQFPFAGTGCDHVGIAFDKSPSPGSGYSAIDRLSSESLRPLPASRPRIGVTGGCVCFPPAAFVFLAGETRVSPGLFARLLVMGVEVDGSCDEEGDLAVMLPVRGVRGEGKPCAAAAVLTVRLALEVGVGVRAGGSDILRFIIVGVGILDVGRSPPTLDTFLSLG